MFLSKSSIALLITSALSLLSPITVAETQVRGLIQGQIPLGTDNETSFFNGGTGLLKFDDQHDNPEISQALLEVKSDLTSTLKLEAVLNHTTHPDSSTNFTQLGFRYNPIWSQKYRWQLRGGMFYPQFGFENPDIGWLSPFNYTNSAISTWIGEELRTLGAEVKFTRPGRAHGSPHTFSLTGSFYKANDPTGTLLAWRGWGLHDKQTQLHETVPFAYYPSIQNPGFLNGQKPWVDVFREIDGRWGLYAGMHWDYKQKSEVRFYYYNNKADENKVARGGQYAWQTLFNSLSWQYRFNSKWRLIMHYMDGNTSMGPYKVNVDFRSWNALISYKTGPHRFSARYDKFSTSDKDKYPQDQNDSNGFAFTTSYRYDWNKHIQLGLEYVFINRFQANRAQWYWDTDITQHQMLGVAQYRF